MSEEMAGHREAFFKGHETGMKEGYLKALADLQREVNCVSVGHQAITVKFVKNKIDKLYVEINK